jgi:nucleotide-binding universal stress UspA family protein
VKNIIVPIDFSDASLNASEYALDMAVEINASITLFHTYNLPIYYGDVPIVATDNEKIITLKSMLENLKNKLFNSAIKGIIIDTKFMTGDFLDELQKHCQDTSPDCIVMGCQGKSSFENIFFGSNAIAAMKQLHFTTLLIPYDASFANIKRLGLAFDFKTNIEAKAIHNIRTFATNFLADIFVCNIGDQIDDNLTDTANIETLNIQLKNFSVSKYIIVEQGIENGLKSFITECKLDVLVIFPKQDNFWENIWHININKKMVLHSSIPILALHAN